MATCFVIQPFDEANDRRYEEVYKPALEAAAVTPYRVDRDPSIAVPIDSIENKIREADISLADITTHNPNVWYELGFASATGRPVVMICERAAFPKLPFDLQHRLVVKYATASPTDFERLKKGRDRPHCSAPQGRGAKCARHRCRCRRRVLTQVVTRGGGYSKGGGFS